MTKPSRLASLLVLPLRQLNQFVSKNRTQTVSPEPLDVSRPRYNKPLAFPASTESVGKQDLPQIELVQRIGGINIPCLN